MGFSAKMIYLTFGSACIFFVLPLGTGGEFINPSRVLEPEYS